MSTLDMIYDIPYGYYSNNEDLNYVTLLNVIVVRLCFKRHAGKNIKLLST